MKRYRAIAEYYDCENERLEWLRRDVGFFLRHLPKQPQEILELATGTGRVAIPLAQAGHRVVGVDYASDMLAIARRKRDAVGLNEQHLQLLNRDVLRLKLNRKLDWVCILFNTFLGFTTLAQQDKVLQVVRNHLEPSGKFWLDIFQPNLALLAGERTVAMDGASFYVPRYKRTVMMTTDVRRDPSEQIQHVTFNYKWFDKFGVAQHQKTRFDITFIFPRELRILLERNGFRIRRMYGNYDGKPLNADSPRMIVLAEPVPDRAAARRSVR